MEQLSREACIANVVQWEWDMFQAVQNKGGKAFCQEEPETFAIMRRSQLRSWSDELIRSYYLDLEQAEKDGRNLLTEKYAWMMEYTFPEEFASLAEQLPPVLPAAQKLIEEILAAHRQWEQEVTARFPLLRGKGRPATAQNNREASVSIYLQGELKTLSPATLALYHRDIVRAQAKGENLVQRNLEYMVREYGYTSLAAAEEALSRQQTQQ